MAVKYIVWSDSDCDNRKKNFSLSHC